MWARYLNICEKPIPALLEELSENSCVYCWTLFLLSCTFKTWQWCRWRMRADDMSQLAHFSIIVLWSTRPSLPSAALKLVSYSMSKIATKTLFNPRHMVSPLLHNILGNSRIKVLHKIKTEFYHVSFKVYSHYGLIASWRRRKNDYRDKKLLQCTYTHVNIVLKYVWNIPNRILQWKQKGTKAQEEIQGSSTVWGEMCCWSLHKHPQSWFVSLQ